MMNGKEEITGYIVVEVLRGKTHTVILTDEYHELPW